MNSGSTRGFTVVTIITLIFTPVFAHKHWAYEFVGLKSETHKEQCVVAQPCPERKVIVEVVKPPLPPDPPKPH
jgi:hypothetical protein